MAGLESSYEVTVIRRNGMGQVADDWHATITRNTDGKQAVCMARWRWLLRWRTRRGALDRDFRRLDRRAIKLAGVESYRR